MQIIKYATILDVRSPEEFAEQHIPTAINIPLGEISTSIEKIRELPKPILAYCRSGNRSGVAVEILKQNGITEAIDGGGIDDLLQAIK